MLNKEQLGIIHELLVMLDEHIANSGQALNNPKQLTSIIEAVKIEMKSDSYPVHFNFDHNRPIGTVFLHDDYKYSFPKFTLAPEYLDRSDSKEVDNQPLLLGFSLYETERYITAYQIGILNKKLKEARPETLF